MFYHTIQLIQAGPSVEIPKGDYVGSEALLDAERRRIEQRMGERRVVEKRFGVCIVSDGASDVNRRPILDVLSVSGGLVEYVDAKDCSGHVKDAKYISDYICEHIEGLALREDAEGKTDPDAPKSVVMVLMDNATRSSWPLIEKRCPWVTCGPCVPHVLNLLVGDISKLEFVKQTLDKGGKMRNFIRGYGAVLAAFRRAVGPPGEIIRVGTTLSTLPSVPFCSSPGAYAVFASGFRLLLS